MITVIIYFIIYFAVEAVHDWTVILWGQELSKLKGVKTGFYSKLWHRTSAVQTVLLALLPFVLLKYCHNPIMTGVWVLVLRWTVLDMVLNILRGMPVLYVGTTSDIDRLYHWTRHPELAMAFTKAVVIGICTYFSIFGI